MDNVSKENVAGVLKAEPNLNLVGSWRSDVGALDQYG